MEKVFVTGITGKSGSYLLDEIISFNREDYLYTFLVRNHQKADQIKAKSDKFKVLECSFEDRDKIEKEFVENHYDTLLHIAGVLNSMDIVPIAIKYGVKRLILVHTTGIYSKCKEAGEAYRQIEAKIRNMIEGKGITLTILRPTMIYGTINDHNVAVFMKMVYKLRIFPVVNHAAYELQPVWCGDLGKAYYQVLTHPVETNNKDYNLSGGKPILLIDMFKTMARKLGVKNHYVNVPFGIAFSGAWLIYVLSLAKIDFREKVQRLVEPRVYSHADAKADFGYAPVSFEEGINSEINEFLESVRKTK